MQYDLLLTMKGFSTKLNWLQHMILPDAPRVVDDEGSRPDDQNPVAALPTGGANFRAGSSAMHTMRD
jgi:hypothetical protein